MTVDGVVLVRFYKDGKCISTSCMKCYNFKNIVETFDVKNCDEIAVEFERNYGSVASTDSYESDLDTDSSESTLNECEDKMNV